MFAKQANLQKAAKGSRDIASFFTKKIHVESPGPVTAVTVHLSQRGIPESETITTSEFHDSFADASDLEPIQTNYTVHAPNTPKSSPGSPTSPTSPAQKQQQDVNPEHIHSSTQTKSLHDTLKQPNLTEFLDITADDEDELLQPPLWDVVMKLIGEAKKHQSFPALFKLQAVKNYLELLNRYRHIPNIKNPITQAGLVVAKSVGKGPYFARKIRRLVTYVDRFHTLPPTGSGKHHAHPSLLNNEQIYQAVRRYLAVQEVGEVSMASSHHK